MKFIKSALSIGLLLSSLFLTACAVNPVTGRNELSLVSEQQELNIGAEQYGPSQQSQGGEYSVDAELSEYVNTVGQRLAAVSDRALPYEFVVLNNSVPNAWALPGGKIAVNRGLLLELNSEAELAAVLGHEVVHAAARHGALAMTRGTLLQGALVIGAFASRNNEYSDYIVGGSQLGAQLVSQRYGRDAERESDYYGIQYMARAGYDPRAAITLQETFVRLSEGQNQSWLNGLFASHPPSQERVDNNRALVAELMPGLAGQELEMGTERYQQATAYLHDTKSAYDLFDEAERAIADDDLEIALGNLDEASAMVPGEARFSGLKADILLYQRRYRESISFYNEAIAKDDNYYDYYLGRGVAYARQGSDSLAKADLERSANLLPTAIAMNELGKISLNANDRIAARQYFQMAASAQSSVGQEASQAFMRLDIEDNPSNYLQVQASADRNGRIFARVINRSGLDLQNITVEFSAVVVGRVQQDVQTIARLSAESYVDVVSVLSFPAGIQWSQNQLAVQVTNLQVQ
ncbi:M48 family metalloprotease [Gammaproteobacteria bacterium]|nr:M48 family metalloprotease [Gammaproteobacteria bacterium]